MTTVYAAYEDALFAVDDSQGTSSSRTEPDDADTPTLREHSFDSRPQSVAVAGGTVFVGTFEHGLQRSTDGDTWVRADGIEQDAVTALAVDPDDSDTVFAGTEPSRLYRSTDGGVTFEPLDGLTDLPSSNEWAFPPRPDTHHVRWVEPDPADTELLHVAVEAGALARAHLTDDPVRWEGRVPGSRRDVHTIATHPDAPGHAWVAAGDGYAETLDAGDTWQKPRAGLDHTYCWSVAVGLTNASTGISTPRVLLSAATSADDAHRRGESYLYRREGGAWERLDDRGIPTGEGVYRAVLERGAGDGTFWAANNHGLYRSNDGGDSWRRVDVSFPDRVGEQCCRGLAVVN